MKKPTFTKGPWHVQFLSESEKLPYMVFDDNIAAIARVHSEKDARLVAAAPEMHAALIAVLPILEDCSKERRRMRGETRLGEHRDKLRELLAKVEGEECDISLEDKFECEQCGRVDDIEESRQLGGKKGVLVCGDCVEGEK